MRVWFTTLVVLASVGAGRAGAQSPTRPDARSDLPARIRAGMHADSLLWLRAHECADPERSRLPVRALEFAGHSLALGAPLDTVGMPSDAVNDSLWRIFPRRPHETQAVVRLDRRGVIRLVEVSYNRRVPFDSVLAAYCQRFGRVELAPTTGHDGRPPFVWNRPGVRLSLKGHGVGGGPTASLETIER